MPKITVENIKDQLKAELRILQHDRSMIKQIIDSIYSVHEKQRIGKEFLGWIHLKIIDVVSDLRLLEESSPKIRF